MTKNEFRKATQLQRLRGKATINACRYVLVDGMAQAEAARKAQIGEGALSRALAKLRSNACPFCKRPM